MTLFLFSQVKDFVPSTHTSDRDCVAWLESNGAAVEDLVHSTRKEFTAAAVTKLLKVRRNYVILHYILLFSVAAYDVTFHIIKLSVVDSIE